MQSMYRSGQVQLFLQTTPRCRTCIHCFKHGSTRAWTVRECVCDDNTNKVVTRAASICDRWRSAGNNDREFNLPGQFWSEASCPLPDLFDPLQGIIVGAAGNRRG